MSIDFTVPEANPELRFAKIEACPKCGASMDGRNYGDPSCDYDDGTGTSCGGYGPTPAQLRPESRQFTMNVSNDNALIILRDLLNYGLVEKSLEGGELDPSDVLIRLSLAGYKIPGLVREPTDTQGERVVLSEAGVSVEKTARSINCGMSQERLERYVETLTNLAHKALELGVNITYG